MGKYEEALERAKQGLPIDEVFPELKESEDEKFARIVLDLPFKHEADYKFARAYLEKQKEQKPLSTEETELNSIAFLEQLGYTCVPPKAEQKPAEWSEDDEKMLRTIISDGSRGVELDSKQIAWLKSLPERFNLQSKQEWSEEDDGYLMDVKTAVNDCFDEGYAEGLCTWLKSLRPKPHWRPSDEQIRPLEYAIDYFKKKKNDTTYLESLLNDLKKL